MSWFILNYCLGILVTYYVLWHSSTPYNTHQELKTRLDISHPLVIHKLRFYLVAIAFLVLFWWVLLPIILVDSVIQRFRK